MTEIELLRRYAQVSPPDETVLAEALRQLEGGYQAPVKTSRRTRRIAAIAAAAAAALTFPVLRLGEGTPASDAAAVAFLQSVATRAAAQPADARNAPYWYSHSVFVGQARISQDRQIWLGHASPGRLIQTPEGEMPRSGPARFSAGGLSLTWDQLWTLPTDPIQLEHYLREHRDGAGIDADEELFTEVGDLLRESPSPPALRAALFRVAARIPGVQYAGAVTDQQGRAGIAIRRAEPDSDKAYTTYVVDPTSGALIDEASGTAGCAGYLASGKNLADVPPLCRIVIYIQQGPVTDTSRTP